MDIICNICVKLYSTTNALFFALKNHSFVLEERSSSFAERSEDSQECESIFQNV